MAMSVALVYFFMIIAQRKQRRRLQAMRDALKDSDSMVTKDEKFSRTNTRAR
jgi:preprotein translocase subunit YajC